jgi:hypothetical protein
VVARVLHICREASADDYSLLLQTEHWLEACDHKHRYGSNLKPYFRAWLESETHQSFFKWLDEGEGRHLDIPERCATTPSHQRPIYLRTGIVEYLLSTQGVLIGKALRGCLTAAAANSDALPECTRTLQ